MHVIKRYYLASERTFGFVAKLAATEMGRYLHQCSQVNYKLKINTPEQVLLKKTLTFLLQVDDSSIKKI